MTIKEIKVKRFFFFGFPFGWFSCCQADKLVIEQESKRRAAREKRADEGELIILQSKGCFFFFTIIIHPQLKKPVKLTERDERQLCLFVLFLPFFLSSFLSFFLSFFLPFFLVLLRFGLFALPGDSFGCEWVSERVAELGKASVSIYPHHYPHWATPHRHTHRVQSPLCSPPDDTLTSGKVLACDYRRRGDYSRLSASIKISIFKTLRRTQHETLLVVSPGSLHMNTSSRKHCLCTQSLLKRKFF